VRERPPVVRPRAPREREPEPDTGEDPQAVLEAKVRRAVDGGGAALSAVTHEVTAPLPGPERFVEAGRVAHAVARLARARAAIERPWVPVGDDLVIEEWSIARIAPVGEAGGDEP
jgi:hypothetical protein